MDLPPDENRGPILATVVWIFNGLSIIVVSCRLYTRIHLTRSPWIDDIIIVISLFLNLTSAALITAAIPFGMGRHQAYIQPTQLAHALKLNSMAQPFSVMGFCVPKIAVALLLIRLMGPAKHGLWFLWFLMSTLMILGSLNAIFVFLQCDPPDAGWKLGVVAHCWPARADLVFNVFVGVYSAVCDLSLAIFPITIFWSLQLPLKRKIAICGVMGLGVFSAVCALIKVTTLAGLGAHADITWATVDLFLWTAVEISVIIICACVPTLGPLLQILLGRRTENSRSQRTHHITEDSNATVALAPLSKASMQFSALNSHSTTHFQNSAV